MQKLLAFILFSTTYLISHCVFAEQVSIEHFSKGAEYSNVKISPNGNYIAVTSKPKGKALVAIIDLRTFKFSHVVKFAQNAQVGDYYWVNDERIVLEKEYIKGWQDHPTYHGELFGVNVDGKKGRYLVGHNGEQQTGTRLKKATPLYGTSYVLDPLIDDPRHMLIVTYPWVASKEPYTRVYKVDVYKGTRKGITRAPAPMANYLTDHQGNVRAAISTSDYVDQQLYLRSSENKKWQQFDLAKHQLSSVSLHSFDKSGKHIFVSASKQGEPEGLYKFDVDSQSFTLLHQNKVVSPTKVWVDRVSKQPYAVEYDNGYPSYNFIDKKSVMSKRLKGLLGALKGNQVQIVSSTVDGDTSIVRASSDINSGEYYIFDAKKNKLNFLFATKKWLNPDLMAQTQPVKFKARDGVTIHGYLTLPEGKEAKNLPLVVMPHGGPHGPRDYWEFDTDSQLLASRGMAVLRVNFRGSGGYGPSFEHAGHRKWGAEIQYDIIDGVNHVIEQGIANKDNMCIMGASFGGYSALQSSIIEPDLFKCAIGVVGVYSLPLMFEEGDISESDSGQSYLTEVLGTNVENLKAFSPTHNIDKLKAPVLIVHGGEDERAPIEQAEALVKALDDANHPYEYELLKSEGHGFYKPEHRIKYYQKVLGFLDQHLAL